MIEYYKLTYSEKCKLLSKPPPTIMGGTLNDLEQMWKEGSHLLIFVNNNNELVDISGYGKLNLNALKQIEQRSDFKGWWNDYYKDPNVLSELRSIRIKKLLDGEKW